jgi:hypothetical protein
MSGSQRTRTSTRTTTPARATRRKNPVSLAEVPAQARRGYTGNAYGDEEQLPIASGLADVDSSLSFAQELRGKVDEAHKASIRPKLHTEEPPTISKSKSNSPPRKSPSPEASSHSMTTRSRSKSVSPPVEDSIDYTLPDGGMEKKDRTFNDLHEAGLEIKTDIPGFLDLLEVIFGVIWTALYALPVLLGLYLCVKFGPVVWDNFSLGAFDPFIFPRPLGPQISTVQPVFEATSQPISVAPVVSSAEATVEHPPSFRALWQGRDKAIEDLRDELHGVKSQVRLVSEEVKRLDAWKSAAHRPNFFSPTLGALIYLSYTTPTNARGTNVFSRAFNSFMTYFPGPWKPLPPPSTALTPWKENGDCWCASASPAGALSLGVILNKPVFPGAFVVDHIPKQFALNISSAPKRLDFWGRVSSEFDPESLPAQWRENQRNCESDMPKGKSWVCLGKMFYNIEDSTSAQNLLLDSYEGYPPFKIDRVVLRVLENYGQDHTCLYQVKLEGWLNDHDDR